MNKDIPTIQPRITRLPAVDNTTKDTFIVERTNKTPNGEIVLSQNGSHVILSRLQQRALKDYFNLDRIDL